MHPIERLRYVARSQGAPAEVLVSESAQALGAFRNDTAGLLAASRRILDRHLSCGPLWWLCSRMLVSPEPFDTARASLEELVGSNFVDLVDAAIAPEAKVVIATAPYQSVSALIRRGDLGVDVVDYDDDAQYLLDELRRLGIDAEPVDVRDLAGTVAAADVVLLEVLAAGDDEALVPAGSAALVGLAAMYDTRVLALEGVGRRLPETLFASLLARWGTRDSGAGATEERIPLGDHCIRIGATATAAPVAAELLRLDG